MAKDQTSVSFEDEAVSPSSSGADHRGLNPGAVVDPRLTYIWKLNYQEFDTGLPYLPLAASLTFQSR